MAQYLITPFLFAALVATAASANEQTIDRDGTQISARTRIAEGTYSIVDAASDGAVQIKGHDIVVDFGHAVLVGADESTPPDEYRGIGIIVEDSRNVVIKGARVRGYKVGILVRNCPGLVIEDCDVSGNYRQHLLSTPQAEDGADWLFGHENDAGEWLRYGAGIYVESCPDFTVRSCRCRRGQNGLCVVRSSGGKVYDNDFSFNSGWGLALYRACRNTVSHNKLDWCIRGYSHGVYNRGQDSAGIFVFEQSSDNVFAYNSATHGGDGFFLFAGLETLEETGQGGCNRNLLFRNDFSHASNNGIEATFSEGNQFIENIMDEADHAIWAGYSYDTTIVGNRITRCRHGISIEHGSDNRIEGNEFANNGVAVNLWANEGSAFADKPYGKFHHCRSENYDVARNRFKADQVAVRLGRTSGVTLIENDFDQTPTWLEVNPPAEDLVVRRCNLAGDYRVAADVSQTWDENFTSGRALPGGNALDQRLSLDLERTRLEHTSKIPDVPGTQDASLPAGTPRGLNMIFVDEWGPYDFSGVKVSPARPVAWGEAVLRALGPPGEEFGIGGVTPNVSVSPLAGTFPAEIRVMSADRRAGPFSFTVRPSKGRPLTVSGHLLFGEWRVTFRTWPPNGERTPPADWNDVISRPAQFEQDLERVDFRWGGGPAYEGGPADYFATVSEVHLELPGGDYEVKTVSDDGVRVAIDGQAVIDNWTWHPPATDTARVRLAAGRHTVKIEHFEIDGVAQLQFWLEPVE